jgi:phosphoenolpyruvate-protein phosphotransferase (PTS system enzyme I)
MPENTPRREITLHGIAASPGVAHGLVFRFLHGEVEVPCYSVPEESQTAEISRLEQALLETREQIKAIRADVENSLGESEASIFDAHVLVLEDQALIDDIVGEVHKTGDNVEQCLHRVSSRYLDFFDGLEDQYLRERASDVRDVTRRLLRNLLGATGSGTAFLDEPRVLVSEDLTPSDTASLDRSKILGIATDSGGRSSHAVIMARAGEIPAVVGLRELTVNLQDGDTVLVDGFEGTVVINPSEQTLFRYGKVRLKRKKIFDLVVDESSLPAETADGRKLTVFANADSPQEVAKANENGARGVGLFRTESIFLRCNRIPDEEEQFQEYKAVVEAASPLPVTIRTLDLGGDKVLGSSARVKEDNPFMGFRAIRFCLRNKNVFLTQLRAILRASAFGQVKIMFPMISGVGEIHSAREVLDEAKSQLDKRGEAFDPQTPVGCMIETPAAVTICDLLAEHADFFSIGTNDLVQYLLAVDRINNQIAYLYEPHHPAVIRALGYVAEVGSRKGVDVSVCGEMAGDPHYTALLMGLGIDEMSVAPPLIPELKFFARRFTILEAKKLREDVDAMARPSEILVRIKAFHDEKMADVYDIGE